MRKLDGAILHDFRTAAGEFEHFFVGNLIELGRIWDETRVSRVNTIHIGADLAKVRLQRRRDRNRTEIRATTTERSDLTIGRLTLEAG